MHNYQIAYGGDRAYAMQMTLGQPGLPAVHGERDLEEETGETINDCARLACRGLPLRRKRVSQHDGLAAFRTGRDHIDPAFHEIFDSFEVTFGLYG